MNQTKQPHSDQARNSEMDKTDAYRDTGEYANQGGGKLGSGTQNSGHPANDVINPHSRLGDSDRVQPQPGERAGERVGEQAGSMQQSQSRNVGEVKGTKGSGSPTLSGAGERADDRPGRNDPKSDHASSSLNTHE
jgi:hypothetical protein